MFRSARSFGFAAYSLLPAYRNAQFGALTSDLCSLISDFCIDFPVTAHYPRSNTNKRATGFSTGSAAKTNKTVVRCGKNIESGRLKQQGIPGGK
jgi:hypothetical protein